MKANGSSHAGLQKLDQPPGHAGETYIIPSLCGEIIYIPCSRSATRLLVTGKETDNAFAIVGSGGAQSPPIGFHYHKQAHDVFLCIKGQVNVWADDQARTMNPGDFASVPPNTVHQYQILGDHTEFLGLIVPGGWEEFFRFIGESYTGPLFPLTDARNPLEVLVPKLKAAAEQFDMIPQPHYQGTTPTPLQTSDNLLPGTWTPYFLRNSSGPAYQLGGTVCRPLATQAESNHAFSIASIEGSLHHATTSSFPHLSFTTTHHCFQVSDGAVKFTVDGVDAVLNVGETIYIPSHTEFRLEFVTRFAKAYVFSNGAGLSEIYTRLGVKYTGPIPPEQAEEWDTQRLSELKESLAFEMV